MYPLEYGKNIPKNDTMKKYHFRYNRKYVMRFIKKYINFRHNRKYVANWLIATYLRIMSKIDIFFDKSHDIFSDYIKNDTFRQNVYFLLILQYIKNWIFFSI